MTYEQLEARLAAWAQTQPAIRAVIVCGSRARGDADRWSDLDAIIFTSERERYAATLTRAVSLATRRFGSNFLSVGRVQSPTLALIVERELERRAHKAEPFWEVLAKFEHPDGSFEAHHETDKFWKREEADAAVAGTKSPGKVKEVALATQHPPSADPLQHHRLHHRRLEPARDHAFACDADSPRSSTWTASSPTRAPTTRSIRARCRSVSWSARWSTFATSRRQSRFSTAS